VHSAKVICDSVCPNHARLTTFVVTMPRIVLAEFNTHRMFSRNSASSRAIPVERMLNLIQENPYVPTHWGKNQKGMQAYEEVAREERHVAQQNWLRGLDCALRSVRALQDVGIHKQTTNRLLEPFMWHTVLVTATEWDNFWHQRDHEAAHPDIRKVARLMRDAYEQSTPKDLAHSEWHLPFIEQDDIELAQRMAVSSAGSSQSVGAESILKKVSAGRCAAVSYMRQEEKDFAKDIARCEGLVVNGHMSPLEHVARPMSPTEIERWRTFHVTLSDGTQDWTTTPTLVGDTWLGTELRVLKCRVRAFHGNFDGWLQYRKQIHNEADILSGYDA